MHNDPEEVPPCAPSQERKKNRLELMLIWSIAGLSVLLIVIMVAACNPVRTTQSEAPEGDPVVTETSTDDTTTIEVVDAEAEAAAAVEAELTLFYGQMSKAVRGSTLESCVSNLEERYLAQKPLFNNTSYELYNPNPVKTPEEEAYTLLRYCSNIVRDSLWHSFKQGKPGPYQESGFAGERVELPAVTTSVHVSFDTCARVTPEGYAVCVIDLLDDYAQNGDPEFTATWAARWDAWNAKWATPAEGDLAALMESIRPLMDHEDMVSVMLCGNDDHQMEEAALRLLVEQLLAERPDFDPGTAANSVYTTYYGPGSSPMMPGQSVCARFFEADR